MWGVGNGREDNRERSPWRRQGGRVEERPGERDNANPCVDGEGDQGFVKELVETTEEEEGNAMKEEQKGDTVQQDEQGDAENEEEADNITEEEE